MSPSKKRKLADTEEDSRQKPICFSCPGHEADVQITVFDQEFRVHSVLLKIHSAFFRKFLDSPDKNVANDVPCTLPPLQSHPDEYAPAVRQFKYSWVTKVDVNGKDWSLVCKSIKNEPYDVEKYTECRGTQTKAFYTLLKAMYHLPYNFRSADEIVLVTELADYYCALPILSRTLTDALHMSHGLSDWINSEALRLVNTAMKLHHAMLFRECIIWLMGPHRQPRFWLIKDINVSRVARIAHRGVCAQLNEFMVMYLTFATDSALDLPEYKDSLRQMYIDNDDNKVDGSLNVPIWVRRVSEHWRGDSMGWEALLRNNLAFQHRSAPGAGEEENSDHFFCAEVADGDLPWDIEETEW